MPGTAPSCSDAIRISHGRWWTGSAGRCYDRAFGSSRFDEVLTRFCKVPTAASHQNLVEPGRTSQNLVEPDFMRSDSVVFGIAGIFFGVLVGWIIGSQRATVVTSTAPSSTNAPSTTSGSGQAAPPYDEAARWYEQALKINPKNVNASTDLGIAYYYSNQPDRALSQFDRSLQIDPKHSKTLLNIGIVRAFGKQDIEGAEKAWQRVLELAPNTPEAEIARKGLDGIRAGHGQGSTPS